jgi:hypothetical protein
VRCLDLSKKNTKCYIGKSLVERCEQPAIECVDGAELDVEDCQFRHVPNDVIYGSKCQIRAKNCVFEECRYGIFYDGASGWVDNCDFIDMKGIAICIMGASSTPVLRNCRINKCARLAVIARDACRPIFCDCSISDVPSHAFSCSDFSEPIFWNIEFSGIALEEFCISNGSRATIYCDKTREFTGRIKQFAQGSFVKGLGSPDGYATRPLSLDLDLEEGEDSTTKLRAWLHSRGDSQMEFRRLARPVDMKPEQGEIDPLELTSKIMRRDDHKVKCYQCGKKSADQVCFPCGHEVVCEDCRHTVEGSPGQCPLCLANVYGCHGALVSESCVICRGCDADTMFWPCGHQCVCFEDAVGVTEKTGKCPVCGKGILHYRHVFGVPEKEEQR